MIFVRNTYILIGHNLIRLENIKQASQIYINGVLKDRLNKQLNIVSEKAGALHDGIFVGQDPTDMQQQTLLIYYPSVCTNQDSYVKPIVKIEGGAKSALDPHRLVDIQPYIAEDVLDINLSIQNIVTIDAERTFWDKIMILHGLRRWHDNRGELRHQGHRVSRHYYDLYKLIHSAVGQRAKDDFSLGLDCARHARMFFNSGDLDLIRAKPGSFSILPSSTMEQALKNDYQAMAGMIFGEIPEFTEVLGVIKDLETMLNQ